LAGEGSAFFSSGSAFSSGFSFSSRFRFSLWRHSEPALFAGEESASLLNPMATKTIDQLIINSPYSEPAEHWKYDRESRLFSRAPARRPAGHQGTHVIPNEVRNLLFS